MGIIRNIGKNTIGDNNKMTVDMRTYNRSTHNLSYAFRTTMGVGTLVPCMKILSLPGDTFEINIGHKVMTHPTVGPLFGNYKFQVHIFSCPIRLYNAMLHNNTLKVGLDMSKVKLPKISVELDASKDNPTSENPWSQIHPSCVLAYLGLRGWGANNGNTGTATYIKNGVPILAYLDIFKNYYANKQEDKFYALGGQETTVAITDNLTYANNAPTFGCNGGKFTINKTLDEIKKMIFVWGNTKYMTYEQLTNNSKLEYFYTVSTGAPYEFKYSGSGSNNTEFPKGLKVLESNPIALNEYNLSEIDDLREYILSKGKQEVVFTTSQGGGSQYLKDLLTRGSNDKLNTTGIGNGLLLKTHNSDIFNNWVNDEWITGENGISAITAIKIENNKFTIDTLNLATKVYEMLNRIAVGGGTYQDWITTVYTSDARFLNETPMFEGGISSTIEFEEVVSNSATAEEPLGTLAGRGVNTQGEGGNLKIKVEEPSYLIGIASITPNVDYSQGNDWDMNLQSMNDLRKPQLDGIGFQDLLTNTMAWWKDSTNGTNIDAIGKQPAWINYMTNFNKTYGNFVAGGNESFMCLNRIYEPEDDTQVWRTQPLNSTTYINPRDYTYIFAEPSIEAQDFWVQIGFKIEARRVGGAKQIPTL